MFKQKKKDHLLSLLNNKKLTGSLSTLLSQDMSSRNKSNKLRKRQTINNSNHKSAEMLEKTSRPLQCDRQSKYLKFSKSEQLRKEIKFEKLRHKYH